MVEGAALVVEFHEDFRPTSLEPRVYWVDYNQDRLDYLLDLAEQFVAEGPSTVMDGLLARRVEAMRAKDAATAEIAGIDAEIMQLIGDREEFKHVSDLGTITLSRPSPRETFQLSKFKESYPELVVEQAGHLPFLNAPDAFNKALRALLSAVDRRPRRAPRIAGRFSESAG